MDWTFGREVHGVALKPVPPPHPDGRIHHFVCKVAAELEHKTGRILPYYFKHMSLTQKEAKYLYDKMCETDRMQVPDAWPQFKIPKPRPAKKKQTNKPKLPKKRKDTKIGPMDAFTTNPKFPQDKAAKKKKQPSQATLDKQRADGIFNSRKEELAQADLAPSRSPSPPDISYSQYWFNLTAHLAKIDNNSTPDKKPAAKEYL